MASNPGDGPLTGGRRRPRWLTLLARYGPIATVLAVTVGALVVFGGADVDNGGAAPDRPSERDSDLEALIRSGPMTPARAELEALIDVDFGPNCDAGTGRLRMPSIYAPPCVVPFDGDNGGATAHGVLEDSVLVVYYLPNPALDPLGAAAVEEAGGDTSLDTSRLVIDRYVDLYNKIYETYGRTVEFQVYIGTGAGSDAAAARADAIAIADLQPFAVVGGPDQQSTVFATEIAARGIVCSAGCASAISEDIAKEYEPYIWMGTTTPEQGVQLASEAIGKLAGPGPASMAGDPDLHSEDRVYGLLHYDTPGGDHQKIFETFKARLAEHGVKLAIDIEFTLDVARTQETARTMISRLQASGVTTVIYYGDPITPGSVTREATAQGYHPEWILGPSVLMDTTMFARNADPEQWRHGFGISATPVRGPLDDTGGYAMYEWAYGEEPPNNNANLIDPAIRSIFTGVHLAGPDLTPETFGDGILRYPPTGGGPTSPLISRGDHGTWPTFDFGSGDDATLIWFDPDAHGEDEVGVEGDGMYRFALGGTRYRLGMFPDSPAEAGLFDVERSVTVYDQLPEQDRPPSYPPPS